MVPAKGPLPAQSVWRFGGRSVRPDLYAILLPLSSVLTEISPVVEVGTKNATFTVSLRLGRS